MGQHLSVGICTSFGYYESKKDYRFMGTEEEYQEAFNKELNEEFPLDLYDKKIKNDGDKKYVSFKIKPKILEENIISLIKQQFPFYQPGAYELNNIVIKLEDKNFKEIIEVADDKEYYGFQLLPYYSQEILNNNINMELIAFFLEGKIIMETYGPLFSYFEKMIHIASKENPLSQTIKVRIME
ncbi:MAG: hypothetical protein U9O87_00150 [Verrucomicrobiota bacterium]|nr:hypothetical protein [Verrucomicrobiota bacterium]